MRGSALPTHLLRYCHYMSKLKRLVQLLLLPITWPHEFLHYLPARLLGLEPEIHWDRSCSYPAPKVWQNVVIALTPFVCGAVAFVLSLAGWALFARTLNQHLVWSCVAWVFFWWTAGGIDDLAYTWHYLRTGDWPEKVEDDND